MTDETRSELRYDPIRGQWSLLAPQPQREHLASIPRAEWPTVESTADSDGEDITIWSRGQGDEAVRIVANRRPLYRVEGQEELEQHGLIKRMNGLGAHEMIFERASSDISFSDYAPAHLALILEGIQERMKDLTRDLRLKAFSVFREWTAGASDDPPLSQFIASAVIPLDLQDEVSAAKAYYDEHERCSACAMLEQERNDAQRTIEQNGPFTVLCPYAPIAPFETHIYPNDHGADLRKLEDDTRASLAEAMLRTVKRLEAALPGWRLLMRIRTRPVNIFDDDDRATTEACYHWRVEFLPQAPGALRWDLRSGTPAVHTSPEAAAAFLRGLNA